MLATAKTHPIQTLRTLGALAGALLALTGVLAWQSDRYNQLDHSRALATEQAERAVVKLLSYNFSTIDRQVRETQGLLTGDFRSQYADLITKTVAPTAKDKQIAVHTAVVENAVMTSNDQQMVLLMFLDQQSESRLKNDPIETNSRVQVTLQRDKEHWLVSDIRPL
jgi:Mce-associated membrane protein